MADDDPGFELVAATADPEAHESVRRSARVKLANRRLPPSLHDHKAAARHYRPAPDLLMAVNMALNVGAPLLLTGEPGTGKTQVAEYLGWYFDIPVFKFQVRSDSTAEDMRYEFDAVGYLHWAQTAGKEQAEASAEVESGYDALLARTAAQRSLFLAKGPLWQAYAQPSDAVVLLDEIDKAPRDFPNDLLHELDQHAFKHPFLGHEIKPENGRAPIVVVTSNDERRLPDAFLRRCIFHRIELTEALVRSAVEAHGGDFRLDAPVREAAMARFWELRERAQEKKPSTAELLVWLCILSARGVDAETLQKTAPADLPAIGALLKDPADIESLG